MFMRTLKSKLFIIVVSIISTAVIIAILVPSIHLIKNSNAGSTTTKKSNSTYPSTTVISTTSRFSTIDLYTNDQTDETTSSVPITTSLLSDHEPICRNIIFTNNSQYFSATDLSDITIEDFNNDNFDDILLIKAMRMSFSILLGNGNGTYTFSKEHQVGIMPQLVEVSDLNHDRILDLVIVDITSGFLIVLVGTDDGNYTVSASLEVPDFVISFDIIDVNGDQHKDLVIFKLVSLWMSIFLGFGNGSFMNEYRIEVGLGTLASCVSDLNNDTIPDIIVSTGYGRILKHFINYNNGTLLEQYSHETEIPIFGLSANDINGDGYIDLFVISCENQSVSILIGSPDGYITTNPTMVLNPMSCFSSINIIDINGDNYKDFLVIESGASVVHILFGNGYNGFIGHAVYSFSSFIVSLAVYDFNYDGLYDIVIVDFNIGSQVWIASCS